MPWNETEYLNHHKHLAHMCPYTKQPDGENGVQCDSYSHCGKCGWNPRVAKQRIYKIRLERQKPKEPERWLIGRGEFPERYFKDVVECRGKK